MCIVMSGQTDTWISLVQLGHLGQKISTIVYEETSDSLCSFVRLGSIINCNADYSHDDFWHKCNQKTKSWYFLAKRIKSTMLVVHGLWTVFIVQDIKDGTVRILLATDVWKCARCSFQYIFNLFY